MYKNKDENKYLDYYIEVYTNYLVDMKSIISKNEIIQYLNKECLDIKTINNCTYIDAIFIDKDIIIDAVERFCKVELLNFTESKLLKSKINTFEIIKESKNDFFDKLTKFLTKKSKRIKSDNIEEIKLSTELFCYYHLFEIFEKEKIKSLIKIHKILIQPMKIFTNTELTDLLENAKKELNSNISESIKQFMKSFNYYTSTNSDFIEYIEQSTNNFCDIVVTTFLDNELKKEKNIIKKNYDLYVQTLNKFDDNTELKIVTVEDLEPKDYQDSFSELKTLLTDIPANILDILDILNVKDINLLENILFKIVSKENEKEIYPEKNYPYNDCINQIKAFYSAKKRFEKFENDFNKQFENEIKELLESNNFSFDDINKLIDGHNESFQLNDYYRDVVKELFFIRENLKNEIHIHAQIYLKNFPLNTYISCSKKFIKQLDISFILFLINNDKIFSDFNKNLQDFISYCVYSANIQEIKILQGNKKKILKHTKQQLRYTKYMYYYYFKKYGYLSLNHLIFFFIQFKRLSILLNTTNNNYMLNMNLGNFKTFNTNFNKTLAYMEDDILKNYIDTYTIDIFNYLGIKTDCFFKDFRKNIKQVKKKFHDFMILCDSDNDDDANERNLKTKIDTISNKEHYLSFICHYFDEEKIQPKIYYELASIFFDAFLEEAIFQFLKKEDKKYKRKLENILKSRISVTKEKVVSKYKMLLDNIDSRFQYFHIVYISLQLNIPFNYSYNFANTVAQLNNKNKSENVINKKSYHEYYCLISKIIFKNFKINNLTLENDKYAGKSYNDILIKNKTS